MRQLICDVETYRNYFLVMFMDVESGKTKGFSNYADGGLDYKGLMAVLTDPDAEIITFNGNRYDIPMITFACENTCTSDLKDASDHIIVNNLTPWAFYNKYNLNEPDKINHIDLIEVAPSMCSPEDLRWTVTYSEAARPAH